METTPAEARHLRFNLGIRPHRTIADALAYFNKMAVALNPIRSLKDLTEQEREDFLYYRAQYVKVSCNRYALLGVRGARRENYGDFPPKPAPQPRRVQPNTCARPRGAGRPRRRSTRSSTRAGPSDDPGEPEPGPRSGQALLFLVHPRYGKVSRALAAHLRGLGQ